MSAPPHPISPPPGATSASSGVRRHHTITATSRARAGGRSTISEEPQDDEGWNNDEVVDQDWVGAVGVVGELKGSSLHRQSSLPTRYNPSRAYGQATRQSGTLTPRTLNSLSAIAGQEGEEDDWERDLRGLRSEEEAAYQSVDPAQHQAIDNNSQTSSGPSPMSPHFSAIPSPPPAASAGVRRHQSLTYGAATGGPRKMATSGLRRAGTLQTSIRAPGEHPQSPSPTNAEEEAYVEGSVEDEPSYFAANTQGTEWRAPGTSSLANSTNSNPAIDDVQRALSSLDINNQNQQAYPSNAFPGGQSTHPPRFNPNQPPPQQMPGMRPSNGYDHNGASRGPDGRKLQLVTDLNAGNNAAQGGSSGPASASAYVPPIGHGVPPQNNVQQSRGPNDRDDRAFTASGAWDQKERVLQGRTSNPNLYAYQQQQQNKNVPNVPPIPSQYVNQGMGMNSRAGLMSPGQGQGALPGAQAPGLITSPIDVPTLIATKGYNPTNFDIRPVNARYFVIKSYTEDDVHKSLKYEIWSSTDPGNKRLDKAFKETAARGPIYLFFSVNASGHFCGMAEMLTPVDYTRSSTVWASDKWKGVFKVRWIFVRDIPNANLRHIRLNNTQERKPVTNSRDTQELMADAGQEMLRIFHSHPARTSLLQDFAFYELQSMQKLQQPQQQTPGSPPMSHPSSPSPPQQNAYAMNNPGALVGGYGQQPMPGMQQMAPMMQMGMGSAFVNPHAMQSVMRNPSPVPMGGPGMGLGMSGQPGYANMGGVPGFNA